MRQKLQFAPRTSGKHEPSLKGSSTLRVQGLPVLAMEFIVTYSNRGDSISLGVFRRSTEYSEIPRIGLYIARPFLLSTSNDSDETRRRRAEVPSRRPISSHGYDRIFDFVSPHRARPVTLTVTQTPPGRPPGPLGLRT